MRLTSEWLSFPTDLLDCLKKVACSTLGTTSPQISYDQGSVMEILMFPDTDRQPTEFDQRFVVAAISGDISVQLRFPPGPVGFRQYPVVRATVPETAVEKHGDTCPCEHHVWGTGKPAHMLPESEAETVQFTAQTDLAGRIAPGHASHLG